MKRKFNDNSNNKRNNVYKPRIIIQAIPKNVSLHSNNTGPSMMKPSDMKTKECSYIS